MNFSRALLTGALAFTVTVATTGALAQASDFPNRPVTLVTPFAAAYVGWLVLHGSSTFGSHGACLLYTSPSPRDS